MENIFDSAKFGDKFRTRGGYIAVYIGKETATVNSECCYLLIIDGSDSVDYFYGSGDFYKCSDHPFDIIGKWEEPNIEELAEKYAESVAQTNNLPIETQHLLETAYIAGVNRV